MNAPTKTELAECLQVSNAIVQFLGRKGWDWSLLPNFTAGRLVSTRLSGITVTLGAVRGSYRDIALIQGNSGIRIDIPKSGFRPSGYNQSEERAIRQVISGVLVHECTHVIQQQHLPATYAAALTLERQFHKIVNPSPDECFDFYIGQPLELEARASHAVGEVLDLAGTSVTQPLFEAKLQRTEIWRRTEASIGGPNSSAQKVRSWWVTWLAMAWDIYA